MTATRLPLTREEVQRLQTHLRLHGLRSLSSQQHAQIWDFLLETPESHAWLNAQIQALQAERAAEGWEPLESEEQDAFLAFLGVESSEASN